MKFILIVLMMFVCDFNKDIDYSNLKIYSSFVKAGSTSFLVHEFINVNYSDTSAIEHNISEFEFDKMIKSAKCSRILQQKIVDISFGGEILKNGTRHFLVICLPNRIYDLTEKKLYIIKNKEGLLILSEMENIKH